MTARQADITDPFLGNGSVNTFPLLGRRFLLMQQFGCNNENVIFLHGPCRDDIGETKFRD
jgi:hypothetical protein